MRYRALPILLCCAPTLCGCTAGVLDPKGPVAAAEKLLLINATAIMLVVVVPVILATLAFAWWYRSSNPSASRSADESYEGRLEFVLWSIPALIVILLGGVIWIGSHQLDPRAPIAAKADPIRIDVVALDWKWLFIYPDEGIATVNQMVIPAGAPVQFRLTSATVMNSFFIPALAGQVYAMPGMETQLHAVLNRPGEFIGFSANYSGAGFSDMRFKFHGMSAEEFGRWVQSVKAGGRELSHDDYLQLEKPSEREPVRYYATVAAGLYGSIVNGCVNGDNMCMMQTMAKTTAHRTETFDARP